jgi:hypothetical protein
MDYELGVWTLCAQEERARRLAEGSSESRDVSAEHLKRLSIREPTTSPRAFSERMTQVIPGLK